MATPNNSTELARLALSLLSYDPESGDFHWIRKPSPSSPIKIGDRAGGLASGYRVIRIHKNRISAHRLAWFWAYGELPEKQIDHINRDRLDNRIENLRLATNEENQQNANRRGYYLNQQWGRYVAQIAVNGRSIYLGGYDTEDEARAAYLAAKNRLHSFWTGEKPVGRSPVGRIKPERLTGFKIR